MRYSPLHRSFLYQKRPGCYPTSFPSKTTLVIQLYVFLERKSRKRMVMKIRLPFNRCFVIASPKKRYEILPVETVNFYREKIDRCSAALQAIRQKVNEHGFFLQIVPIR